jgi:prepilin-type N-terminal cleavage/methylation domain-containing protein
VITFQCQNTRSDRSFRNGMTLIELMVVVAITVILLGSAIPLLRPALREGAIREASRQMNVYLSGAKARALEIGRPVGVSIQRTQNGSNLAFEVFMVESPPPYTGDIAFSGVPGQQPDATIRRRSVSGTVEYVVLFEFNTSTGVAPFPPPYSASLVADPRALINDNERFLIKFNYRGPYYACQRKGNDFILTLSSVTNTPPGNWWRRGTDGEWGQASTNDDGIGVADDAREAGWPGTDDVPAQSITNVPYQILLPPRKSAVKPMQLSSGSCIDLEFSGIGVAGTEFDANISTAIGDNPVVISFMPDGDVGFVAAGGAATGPTGSIYLLLNTTDKVGVEASTTPFYYTDSISDTSSIWVSISPRTGRITTAENAWNATAAAAINSPPGKTEYMQAAREYAISGQGMGGR